MKNLFPIFIGHGPRPSLARYPIQSASSPILPFGLDLRTGQWPSAAEWPARARARLIFLVEA
jgi:hypothetical protein